MTDAASSPVAILAGGGLLPLETAAAVSATGRGVHVVAIEGHADPALDRWPVTHVRIGQVGRMLQAFADAGCRDLVIAGSLRRPDLMRLRLDLGAIRRLPVVFSLLNGGDDSLLRKIVRFFEREGLRVVGIGDVAPGLLAPAGRIGSIEIGGNHSMAIERGRALIHALSPYDVGQAVVVDHEHVLAIEGADGTDAMLARMANGRAKGAVLLKLAKSGQELRVDLPAIGPDTVKGAVEAGLSGIAVEAGAAVVLGRAELVAAADAAGIFVTGVALSSGDHPFERKRADAKIAPRGRHVPRPDDRIDARTGLAVLAALADQGGGDVTAVLADHVLAVGAKGETARAVIARAAKGKPWGGRLFRRRAGVVAVRGGEVSGCGAELVRALAADGFAGVVVAGVASTETVRQADASGLFVVEIEEAAS